MRPELLSQWAPTWDVQDCQTTRESAAHTRGATEGCKYALSRACEELAVQAGIQFVQNSPHNGNPFYCPPCDRYFNHGVASLEKHLLESHSVALKHRGYSAPVLDVPGCQEDQTISDTIRGKYAAKGWHHGKPLYQKVEDSDRKVFIYFWDGRDGEWFHGWWFGSGKVGGHFHAYSCTHLDPEDLTVPTSGWKVPWSGEIDWTLNIETCQETCAFSNGPDTKFQWEFDASADGEEAQWQPMSQAMSDALEKRWAQGWHGDNETETFYLQSNGFRYSIDCFCMVQWNMRTGRCRDIRRSEVRADATEVLPKMAEKDAQLERLQTEKNCLLEERNELIAKVNKLEQEKAALANSQADHASQMCLQESWRLNAQLQTDKWTQLNAWDPAIATFRRL
eukprot:s203_g26.t1